MTTNSEQLMQKLFQWKKVVIVRDVSFFMRIVSDQVMEDARKHSLLAARNLRKQLRDTTTEEYLIHIDPLLDLDVEDLTNILVGYGTQETIRAYMQSTPRPIIVPMPENPSQEEQEEYEAAREQREADYLHELQSHVENWRTRYVETLANRTPEQLFAMARGARVDIICQELFAQEFEQYVVAASLYTDDKYKTKAFTFEQFKALPESIRAEFIRAYNDLSISADTIKN